MSQPQFRYHKYLLKSAPYGQLPKVIQNLQKISPFDIHSQQAQQTFKQYNEEHLSLVKLENQTKNQGSQNNYLIFPIAKTQNNLYIDQLTKKAYKINHLSQKVQQSENVQVELPQPVVELLEILTKKLTNYVNKFYRQPNGVQVFMQITEEGALNVHLAFTSKNIQLSNFYTGEWNSIWKINKQKIEGTVNVRAHIFESGNVQMNQNKQLSREFQFTADMEENATNIIKTQRGLSQVYQEMPNGFFKHLRRIAPVTKTKMIWNVNALKMNKNLTQGKN